MKVSWLTVSLSLSLAVAPVIADAATVAHIHFGCSQSNGGVLAVLCGGGDKPPSPSSGTVTGRIRGQVQDTAQCCTSGIRGKVVLGPTCPVIPTPGAENCQDQPYQAEIVVRSRAGFQGRGDGGVSKEVARFTSNSKGEFCIPLPAGTYSLESASTNVGGFPLAKPHIVKVEPRKFTTITFVFDTGIR